MSEGDPETVPARSAAQVLEHRLVGLAELPGDVEPEAGALALGREERLEEVLHRLGGEPRPAVADLEVGPLGPGTHPGPQAQQRARGGVAQSVLTEVVDDLLEQVDSKYRLVLFAAKRARQINAYYAQLGEGLLESVGPLVETMPQEKPLSIALREVQAGQLQYTEIDPAAEAAARAEAFSDPDFTLTDPFSDLDPA